MTTHQAPHAKLAPRTVVYAVAGFFLLAAPLTTAAPARAWVALDRVCLAGPLGLLDATLPANNDIPADVALAQDQSQLGSALVYYGMAAPFGALKVDLGLPGGGPGTLNWYYWDGAHWAPLRVRDHTSNFHASGIVDFHPPHDWASRSLLEAGCGGSFFWVKSATDVTFATMPLGTRLYADA